jgi:hypothetical protein
MEKQIAKAISRAQQLHEESYKVFKVDDSVREYTKDWESCWQEACKEVGLPDQIWYVLYLANHWCNDLQVWAECVLIGSDFNAELKVDEEGKCGS